MKKVWRTKSNSFERLLDQLLQGPQSDETLRQEVGKGYVARISEWNKVYPDMPVKRNTDGLWQFFRAGRISMHHKKAYPSYYINGKYEWPAKQRLMNDQY